ncbi:MAG: M14 family metallocarboxypeptidase [Nanoarchaeota archaeon]|nr:M14 family metallocarboxypeptidase [Nanoarchaeota archaeon]MCG2718870.1 M14 family metallocarboxypeptidase [Nanoarchaeota archaeon]
MKKRSYQKKIVPRIEDLASKFNVAKIGDVAFEKKLCKPPLFKLKYPIYTVFAKSPNPNAYNIFLSAGVHGDEPGGLYSLLEFLEREVEKYLPDFNFTAFPCLNPSGFEQDKRENFDKVDINRNMESITSVQENNLLIQFLTDNPQRYLFSIDMHEDPTDKPVGGCDISENPKKFYLYESSPNKESRRGHKLLRKLEKLNIPICKRKEIYREKNEDGLIWTPKVHNPDYAAEKSVQTYMQKYTTHSFTPETPTCWTLEDCIAAHLKMLSIALEEFLPN